MNEKEGVLSQTCPGEAVAVSPAIKGDGDAARQGKPLPTVPAYLQDTYWWAYLHPNSFWLFEREWVVNLILWGNMRKLTQSVLDELNHEQPGRVLQVACVYGEFSMQLASHLKRSNSRLDLIDVAAIQIDNAEKKLHQHSNISIHHQDSNDILFEDGSFDETVVYFLLHEQPEEVRRKTIAEAIRVTRPGGRVIFVDYHCPDRSNPLRYLMKPILKWLEPFALDMWREKLPTFMPDHIKQEQCTASFYFGGLYQKVVLKL